MAEMTRERLVAAIEKAQRAGRHDLVAPLQGELTRRYGVADVPALPAGGGGAGGGWGDNWRETTPAPVSGPAEAALVGAGRTYMSLYRGAQDLAARAMGDEEKVARLLATETEEAPLVSQLSQTYPKSTLAGQAAPYIAMPIARSVPAAAAMGGVTAATEYQADPVDRLKAGGIGMVGGAAGHKLGQIAAQGLAGRVSSLGPRAEALARRGRKLGFKMSPAQRTGSRALANKEAAMKSTQGAGDLIQGMNDANQETLNRIAAKAIGLGKDVTKLGDDVLGEAHDRLTAKFAASLKGRDIPADKLDDFGYRAVDIEDNFNALWTSNKELKPIVDKALDELAGGTMSAERAHSLSSNIGKAARQAFRGQNSIPEYGHALMNLKDALDDALMAALPKSEQGALREARRQWFLKLAVEANTTNGDLSGKKLANWLRKRDESGFLRGKNNSELYDAARFMSQFGERVGDSGTAARLQIADTTAMLRNSGLAAATGHLTGADPMTLAAAAAIATPPVRSLGARAYMAPIGQTGMIPMLPAAPTHGLLTSAGRGAGAKGLLEKFGR